MPGIQSLLLSVPQFAYLANRDIYDALARVNCQIADIKHSLAQNVANRFVQRQRRESTRCSGRWIQPLGGGAVLSVDLHKAFDMLTREQLLRTLSKLDAEEGVKNAAMLLHTQCQYVLVKDGVATEVNTTRGVRQGCRLAPALWSAVSGDILTQIVQNAFTGPITVFADDHIGAWTFHTVDDIIAMEQDVLRLFSVLSEAGLSVSPSKSKLVVQVQGAAAERYLADRTVHSHGQPHWCFGEGENKVAVPIVQEMVYLGTIVTLGRRSDRTVAHRLEEARKREGQLRKSIRSRSVLRSGTRVAIWRACVVASAFYGLLAQELTAANITTLRQWYHKSLRAVTGMPAHITHVTNADLRAKYGLTEPLAALLKLTQHKLRKLASLQAGHAATLQATMNHWSRCERQLGILAHTDNLTITPLLTEVPGIPCPYCGIYFQHTKAMRQHTARKHGINWKQPLQIDYEPSNHATKGMPECRHCGKKCGSHQGLKHHIMHNTCGWYHTIHTEDVTPPGQTDAGPRCPAPVSISAQSSQDGKPAAADKLVSSQSPCHETTMDRSQASQPRSTERRQTQPAQPSLLPTTAREIHQATPRADFPSAPPAEITAPARSHLDTRDGGIATKEDALPAQRLEHASHRKRRENSQPAEPCQPLPHTTDQTLINCSVWAEFQQSHQLTRMEIGTIVQEWKHRLAQHCCICNNWAMDKSSVKCHLVRMHAKEWYSVAAQVAEACKAHKHLFTRDAQCTLCLKQVYGVERHALQCPVLFQACFMHCLIGRPAAPPNLWKRLRSLTPEACKAYLQGSRKVEPDVSEPLNLFCVLCARKDIEVPITDIQAWRRHLQQTHGVAKAVLSQTFHEQADLVHISRPCPFCRSPFQKSPKLHRSKCLPLAQLISVQHGYAGIRGDSDRRSVGAIDADAGDAHFHTAEPQGQHRKGETGQVSQTGEGEGERSADRAQTPGTSRGGRARGPGPSVANRAEKHSHPAGATRSSAQPAGRGQNLRSLLHDHGDVNPDHATHGDQSLAGTIRSGNMYDHTPGHPAHESVDGARCQADEVREGSRCHESDDGQRTFLGRSAPLGLHSMESTGKESYGNRPATPVHGRAESGDQNVAGCSNDGGCHPQILTHAETGRKHLGSGSGIHPGADDEIQSREGPHGDDQTYQLVSAVADRPAPSSREASAESAGKGAGGHEAVSSKRPPHCQMSGNLSGEALIQPPGQSIASLSSEATINSYVHSEERLANRRLRSPHGKKSSSKPGSNGGSTSVRGSRSMDSDVFTGDASKPMSMHAEPCVNLKGEKASNSHGQPANVTQASGQPSKTLTQTTLQWQVTGSSIARPSAPPAYCLRNRSNFCYLNSVAVALHWSMISSGGQASDYGSLGPALAVLSRIRKIELFTHATWKEILNGWRRPAQQHDVTELMSFLTDPNSRHLAGEWQARCLAPGRDIVCDRGSTSPFLSVDIRDKPHLRDAIASWHAQHYRHALLNPPVLLAIQMGRFQHNGRRTVKVRTPCDIPMTLEVPVFLGDQLGCSSRTYKLCGGIVHVGDLATSGHYRPFCVHQNVQDSGSEVTSPQDDNSVHGTYTLFDDDKPPASRSPGTDNLLRHNTYVVLYLCSSR